MDPRKKGELVMRKTGTGSGGGVGMNKNVSPKVKAGPPSTEKISPCGVSQIGQKFGNPQAIEKIPAGTMSQVPLGNSVAGNVNGGGPGRGREIIGKSGSQGNH
jgi:hypothetical protein